MPTAGLTIDLNALVQNYHILVERVDAGNGGATPRSAPSVGAAVKANGYGLGVVPVVRALLGAGCRDFFVATVDEGIELVSSGVLHDPPVRARVAVLGGPVPGSVEALVSHGLIPVLNSLEQLSRWSAAAVSAGPERRPAILHLDSGMRRLGLPAEEAMTLAAEPERLDGVVVQTVMSHLACADASGEPMNARQREVFIERADQLSSVLPDRVSRSLANSGGIFLGHDYHFDLVRPGVALYGGRPSDVEEQNPMLPVVTLRAPIIQVQPCQPGESVGYGAAGQITEPTLIATIAAGYADGFHRSGSGRGCVMIGETEAPIVGRVSMDLITVDVSSVPEAARQPGQLAQLIGPHRTVDDVAGAQGTISYEVLTSLGQRYQRHYLPVG